MVSSPISTSAAVRVLVACALALSIAACGSQPSHDDLKRVLDAYPVPASFQQVSEREYTFGDGPFGDEANAVARYFDPGELADPREAIVAAAAEAGAQIQDASDDDVRLERIRTVFRDVNVVILTGANPIEVRAFGPLG